MVLAKAQEVRGGIGKGEKDWKVRKKDLFVFYRMLKREEIRNKNQS